MLIYKPSDLEALVEIFNTWFSSEDGQNLKTSMFIVTCAPHPTFTPTFVVVPFYDGDEVEGRRIFKPFFDIGPAVDLTGSHPYVKQVAL